MNQRRRSKAMYMFLVAAMLFTIVLAGCSGSNDTENTGSQPGPTSQPVEENGNGSEETPAQDERFTLGSEELAFEWYLNYDWVSAPSWASEKLGEKWIQDNLKVKIMYSDPAGAAEQKMATMIVDDKYPDVMMVERYEVHRLVDNGKVVALDDYLDKYTNIRDWLGEEVLGMLRADDGKLYMIPNWPISGSGLNGNHGWFVNQKIYNELGRPALETFEHLYEYLESVKENYPDVIPFDGTTPDFFFAGFGEGYVSMYVHNFAIPEGDKLISPFTDEAFVESMLFGSRLFREGLYNQDILIQTNDQIQERLRNGRVAVVASGSAASYAYDTRSHILENDSDWEFIWPIRKAGLDKNKMVLSPVNTLGWNAHVITKDAENPEAIFAYMDWLFSEEGQRILAYGPPNLYWDPDSLTPEGYPAELNDSYYNATPDEIGKMGGDIWLGNTTWIDGAAVHINMTLPEDKQDWIKIQQGNILWRTAKDTTEYSNYLPGPSTDEGIILQEMRDIYEQAQAEILFARSDDEVLVLIDKLIQDMESVGHQELLDYMTPVWKANRVAMGLD